MPATLLGRLAVDRRRQGKGYGRFLLADALYRAARSEIASFAVIVDPKDDNARRFYERESFLPFSGPADEALPAAGRYPAVVRWPAHAGMITGPTAMIACRWL